MLDKRFTFGLVLLQLFAIVVVGTGGGAFAESEKNDENEIVLEAWDSAEPTNWYMAGANAQRTSWVAEEVNPTAGGSFGVKWYRPIEAYNGHHTQLVTGYNKIYIASARGVYALKASNGSLAWRYDTQIPTGHSPTVINNTVYFGGLDRRIYALNAHNGSVRWIFDSAESGFSTSPLVVDGTVYMGNRDGRFYAVNATTGFLKWQYPAANQPALGPIMYSAAYKDGDIYFASNDSHAYALDGATGALEWKSEQLPGDGYQAWWPVVYRDLVVFSASLPYRHGSDVGEGSIQATTAGNFSISEEASNDYVYGIQGEEMLYPDKNSQAVGPTFEAGSSDDTTGNNWAFPNSNATILDGFRLTNYLEDDGTVRLDRAGRKPWRRVIIALNRNDGSEFTFDSDGDGSAEFIPFMAVGAKSGNQYPPVAMPDNNGTPAQILYRKNISKYESGYGIDRSVMMGWTPESEQYLHYVRGDGFAIDEPVGVSGSGNILYKNLCCDRISSWTDITTEQTGQLWDYNKTLESLDLLLQNNPQDLQSWYRSHAPTYDEMWWEASMWGGLPRLTGGYGTVNSVYHNHGLQNPIVPYNGMLFVHRSNAIIALGSNPPQVPANAQLPSNPQPADHVVYEAAVVRVKKRPLLTFNHHKQDALRPIYELQLQLRLEDEVRKMLAAGHLRPGYYGIGQTGNPQFRDYFSNPGDTLLTLSLAYPHVSTSLQAQMRPYMREEFEHYFKNNLVADIGWSSDSADTGFASLAPRESMEMPPEVAEVMSTWGPRSTAYSPWPWNYPQHNFYAIWKYVQIVPSEALPIYNKILQEERLQLISNNERSYPSDDRLRDNPWEHNAYIAAYYGFLGLQQKAGRASADSVIRQQVRVELNRLLEMRSAEFDKDQPWTEERVAFERVGGTIHKRDISIARNFIYMTPELGAYLNTHARDEVAEAMDEYNWVAPYWFVSRYEASVSEGVQHHLMEIPALFQTKAYVLGELREELVKYLDVPAFAVGDLYYMQNIVAALEAVTLADLDQQFYMPVMMH